MLLHLFIRIAGWQVGAHLDDVERWQRVLVLAWLQHKGGGLDPLHDLRQGAGARFPVVELTVGAVEVLLEEGTLGPAEQLFIHDLALAEDVFQTVRRERAGQADPHINVFQQPVQRLEALAGRVLEPRQFVEHDAVEPLQVGQLVEVVVVDHDRVHVSRQGGAALGGAADADRQPQAGRPLGLLDRPDVGADALGRHDQPARHDAVTQQFLHGGQRDGRLAGPHGRQHQRTVALVDERDRLLLVWP